MTVAEARDYVGDKLARRFHRWEMRVDGAIHACAIVAALIGAVALIVFASLRGGAVDVAVVAVYSAGLLTMLGCSAAFNLGRFTRHRPWLQRLDHAAIFLMIAGTYTPFTVLDLEGALSWGFTGLVWAIAVAGILIRLLHDRLFRRVSLGLYLLLGWICLVAFSPLRDALDTPTLALLGIGGALYTGGIVFHLWERLPFQNAIWHAFVVAAAAVHYAAILVSVAAAR